MATRRFLSGEYQTPWQVPNLRHLKESWYLGNVSFRCLQLGTQKMGLLKSLVCFEKFNSRRSQGNETFNMDCWITIEQCRYSNFDIGKCEPMTSKRIVAYSQLPCTIQSHLFKVAIKDPVAPLGGIMWQLQNMQVFFFILKTDSVVFGCLWTAASGTVACVVTALPDFNTLLCKALQDLSKMNDAIENQSQFKSYCKCWNVKSFLFLF